MIREFEQPSLWPCHKETGAEFIATGVDSSVYRVGDLVIKDYRVAPSFGRTRFVEKETLFDYFKITNLANEYFSKNGLYMNLPYRLKEIPVKINPILSLKSCDGCGGVEGVSKYIPGKRLSEVSDLFYKKELNPTLNDLNEQLEKGLNCFGINVIPLNIKVSGNDTLVITDLCADIWMLKVNSG